MCQVQIWACFGSHYEPYAILTSLRLRQRKFSMMKLTPHWTRPPPIARGAPWQQALSPRENRSPSTPCGAHLPHTPIIHTHTSVNHPSYPSGCLKGRTNTSPRHTPLSLSLSILSSVARRDERQSRLCSLRTDTGSRRHNSQ